MLNFIKIRNDCTNCPYLKVPAVDLGKQDRYYSCTLTYATTYDLENFIDICPLKTIYEVLQDFICYNVNAKNNAEMNFKKENAIILSYIEERL